MNQPLDTRIMRGKSMDRNFLTAVVLMLFLLPPALALRDAQQTGGGSTFYFYYGCLASEGSCPSHRWATQTFVPQGIDRITSVDLKLQAITSSTWNPCDSLYRGRNTFDVHIRDRNGNYLGSDTGTAICDAPHDSFDWFAVRFDSPIAVTRGETYEIYVSATTDALRSSSNFAWEGSSADSYPSGQANWNERGSSAPADFTFRINGEATPQCVDNDRDGYGENCVQGADCNDNDRAVHETRAYYQDNDHDSFGSSSSTTSCMVPAGYVSNSDDCNDSDRNINPNAEEACDLIDNNCRNGIDENNVCAGVCWNSADCDTGYVCVSSSCVIDAERADVLLLSPSLFIEIVQEAAAQGIDTDDFDALVTSLGDGYDQVSTPFDAAVLTGESIRNFISIYGGVRTAFAGYEYYWRELADGTQALRIASSANWLDDLIQDTSALQNTLHNIEEVEEAQPLIDIGASFIIGFSRGEGDNPADYTFNSLIYTGGQLITGPYRLVYFFSDTAATLVGEDDESLYPAFAGIRDFMEELTDYYEEGLGESECARSLNQWVACGRNSWNAFTNPLVFIENVEVVPGTSRVTFRVTARNYWGNLIGGDVFIGGSVFDDGSLLCNIQYQRVDFSPGETKTVEFSWDVPAGASRNREYLFTSRVWYSCDNSCGASGSCLENGCCRDPVPYIERTETPFTISNNPPVLNALYCEGFFCGEATEVPRGVELEVMVTGADLDDGDELDFRHEFVSSSDPSILGIVLERDSWCTDPPLGERCVYYRWLPRSDVPPGEYTFRFRVCDGYACDARDLTVEVQDNRPQLLSPLNDQLLHTLQPLFRWGEVVAAQYYQLFIFLRSTGEEVCCPSVIERRSYTLPEEYRLQSGQEYEWEVAATTASGVTLASDRWRFTANCQLDADCGEDRWSDEPFCGEDGNVYQDELQFQCHNPRTYDSYCSSETDVVLKEACEFGCADGHCMRGCEYDEPSCDVGYGCRENSCVEIDEDGDLISVLADCDDTNPEVWQNVGVYRDLDGDGYVASEEMSEICSGAIPPEGYTTISLGIDCNDANPGTWQMLSGYTDSDADGYAVGEPLLVCSGESLPVGFAAESAGADCNDNDQLSWQLLSGYQDSDGDGYTAGAVQMVCSGEALPAGYRSAAQGSDCDDSNPAAWTIKRLYLDSDGDGFTTAEGREVCLGSSYPAGYGSGFGRLDCNDTNPKVHPLAPEVCDRIDNNCNRRVDEFCRVTRRR